MVMDLKHFDGSLRRIDRVGVVLLLLEPGPGEAGRGPGEQQSAERRRDAGLGRAVAQDRVGGVGHGVTPSEFQRRRRA